MTKTPHTNTCAATRTRCVLLGSSLVLVGALAGATPAFASPSAPCPGIGIHTCTLAADSPAMIAAADEQETAPPEMARAASLDVWQRASAPLSERRVTVSYELVAERAEAPMPAGATGTTWTWQMRGDDSTTIVFPCSDAEQGTYRYALRQVADSQRGIIYDSRTFALELYVFSTGADPVCIVRDASGSKISDIGWTVSEQPSAPQGNPHTSPLDKIWGLLPKTGDASALLLVLAALACPPVAIGALIAQRRRQAPATDSTSTSQEA